MSEGGNEVKCPVLKLNQKEENRISNRIEGMEANTCRMEGVE